MTEHDVTDFRGVIHVLASAGVDFVIVGGVAGAIHGSARVTFDVHVCYGRSDDNLTRLVAALAPYAPVLRGAPPDLPFDWSAQTLKAGLNFPLQTTLGDVDLLGEVAGGGRYEDLLPTAISAELFGSVVRCLDLDLLIRTKRAAGRRKDLEAIAELEALREERDREG
jgi:predicted nucleotidyltransferase